MSSLADLYALDPEEFERLVGTVFESLGYEVRLTKRSGDEGIDLELFKGTERSIAQCKRYRGTVGQPDIRDFYGVLVHENAVRGYFVTTGNFSLAASTWAQGKPIALVDGVDFLAALGNSGTALPVASPEHESPAHQEIARAVIAARRSPEEHLAALLGNQLLADLQFLSPVERSVIELRFGLDGASARTPQQVSDELRMTLEGVRRIETQAFQKLGERRITRSQPGASEWDEEWVLRTSREEVARALTADGGTLEERAVLERLRVCLAVLAPEERIVIEMWAGLKDGQRRGIDSISEQLGLTLPATASAHLQALEKLARLWSDSTDIGTSLVRDEHDAQEAARGRTGAAHWEFRRVHAQRPLHGNGAHVEAEFVRRFAPASVLDAHCGAGDIAVQLARSKVDVVGVEPNKERFDAARRTSHRLDVRYAHIWNVDLKRTFDTIVMANDGMLDLALGSESVVLANLARHLRPGGVLIVGFQRVQDLLPVETYDELAATAGLVPVERWSNWDRAPWIATSGYAVLVHRKPEADDIDSTA